MLVIVGEVSDEKRNPNLPGSVHRSEDFLNCTPRPVDWAISLRIVMKTETCIPFAADAPNSLSIEARSPFLHQFNQRSTRHRTSRTAAILRE